jgi:cytochrome c oxidase subunit 2
MGELVLGMRSILMVLCLFVFLAVFFVMMVSLWRHHRRGEPEAPNFHGSVAVEISWALAPCVIVFLMVWPTARAIFGIGD